MAKKPVLTAAEAAEMIPDGATIMCGGFLACGQARAIVKELGKLGHQGSDPDRQRHGPRDRPQRRGVLRHRGADPQPPGQARHRHPRGHDPRGRPAAHRGHPGGQPDARRARWPSASAPAARVWAASLTPVGIDTLVEESPLLPGPSDHRGQGLSADEAHPR